MRCTVGRTSFEGLRHYDFGSRLERQRTGRSTVKMVCPELCLSQHRMLGMKTMRT